MPEYTLTGLNLTNKQISKLRKAMAKHADCNIRLTNDDLKSDKVTFKVLLTNSQLKRMERLRKKGVGMVLKLSTRQLIEIMKEQYLKGDGLFMPSSKKKVHGGMAVR